MKNKALTWDVTCEPGWDPARFEASLAADEYSAGALPGGDGPDSEGRAVGSRCEELPAISGEQLARLLRAEQRDDADVRREVQRALVLDAFVPLSVGAEVEDGVVTLTGTVSRPRERDDAVLLASCVPGVLGITDNLMLAPAPRPRDPGVG
jgi:hypothetical protein